MNEGPCGPKAAGGSLGRRPWKRWGRGVKRYRVLGDTAEHVYFRSSQVSVEFRVTNYLYPLSHLSQLFCSSIQD